MKLIIKGTLPGLNDHIAEAYKSRFAANDLKRDTQDIIGGYILQQLPRIKITKPVIIDYLWAEPNKKRDYDNIAFAKKYINDALVECGVLANDGWKQVRGFKDRFEHDRDNPRVEVKLMEILYPELTIEEV